MDECKISKTCKVILLGDSNVGKTTLIHSFVNEEFRADFKNTLGTDISTKNIIIGNQAVNVIIWDTAGSERFHSVSSQFLRGTEICIFVVDLTSKESLENLSFWRNIFLENVDVPDPEHFPFFIFANKADLTNKIAIKKENLDLCERQFQCPYLEVSAKTFLNVEKGFKMAVEKFLKCSRVAPIPRLEQQQQSEKGCCS